MVSTATTSESIAPQQIDELSKAFVAQFQTSGVVLPAKWIDRMRTLAGSIETSKRFATIFFVDLSGYTAITNAIDEISLDRLRQWFYTLVTSRVEQYGGFIIDFAGDSVFGAFGAPWAFERDSEACVRMMMDVREDIRRQGSFMGIALGVRGGGDCGHLNVRLSETQGRIRPDIFGPAVNLAARLQNNADKWEIQISDTLAEQVRHAFQLQPCTAFEPKNYGRTVQPYAVLSLMEDRALQRRRMDYPLVGRTKQIQQLTTILARDNETFVDIRIVGDAGVGKTRLIREVLKAIAPKERLCATIDCEPHDRFAPMQLASRLLLSIAQKLHTSPAQLSATEGLNLLITQLSATAVGQALVPTLGFLLKVSPYVERMVGSPPKELRNLSITAVSIALQLLAENMSWAIVVDDAQWLDRMTAEALEMLRDRAPRNMALITIARDETEAERLFESDDASSLLETARPVNSTTSHPATPTVISVEPLDIQDREALFDSVTRDELVHPLVRRRVLEESEGIPLYIVEIAHEVSRQIDLLDAEVVSSLAATDTTKLPTSILAILQARIDRLPKNHRAVLQSASILGRRFSVTVLELFSAIREELMGELYALKGLQMIEQEDLPDDLRFYFTPTALRNAAYLMLTKEQQVQLHVKVAELIEQRFATRLVDFAFDLALHFVRGQAPDKAMRHIRAAVDQAVTMGTPHDAYDLLRRALEPLPADAPLAPGETAPTRDEAAETRSALIRKQQRALLEDAGGRATRAMGDYQNSTRHFQALFQLATELNNSAWRASALQQLAVNSLDQGQASDCISLLERAQAENSVPLITQLRIDSVRAQALFNIGNINEALRLWESIAQSAKPDEPLPQTKARIDSCNNIGIIHWHANQLAEALAAFQQAHDMWQLHGIPHGRALCLNNMGIVYEKLGRFIKAESAYQEAAELSSKNGYVHLLSAVEANRANIGILRREYGTARELSSRALHFAKALRHSHSIGVAYQNLAIALAGLGQWEEAVHAFADGMAACAGGDVILLDDIRLSKIHCALEFGVFDTKALLGELQLFQDDIAVHQREWRDLLLAAVTSIDRSAVTERLNEDGVLTYLTSGGSTTENKLRCIDLAAVLLHRQAAGACDMNFLNELRSKQIE